jgi:translation initiation factor 1
MRNIMPVDERPTVYSTEWESAEPCPRCKRIPCRCKDSSAKRLRSLPPSQQVAAIQREKKGRGGKTVTVIRGLQLNPNDMKKLAAQLKQACGTGGTVKDNVIEIQGDQREKVAEKLRSLGYATKFAGG